MKNYARTYYFNLIFDNNFAKRKRYYHDGQ